MTQNAQTATYEPFDASAWKVGIVVADFNKDITASLLQSAQTRAVDYKIADTNIAVTHVAGAVEIPLVLQAMAQTKKYDVLLAIGCVIKGETPHFDYVCNFVTDGILKVQLDESMPVGFGILTCNNKEEAQARMHLGSDHLDAVMHQANAIKRIA